MMNTYAYASYAMAQQPIRILRCTSRTNHHLVPVLSHVPTDRAQKNPSIPIATAASAAPAPTVAPEAPEVS